MFGLWCNGSTTGFGSVCPSSNLGSPTTIQLIAAKNPLKSQVLVVFLLFFPPLVGTIGIDFFFLRIFERYCYIIDTNLYGFSIFFCYICIVYANDVYLMAEVITY